MISQENMRYNWQFTWLLRLEQSFRRCQVMPMTLCAYCSAPFMSTIVLLAYLRQSRGSSTVSDHGYVSVPNICCVVIDNWNTYSCTTWCRFWKWRFGGGDHFEIWSHGCWILKAVCSPMFVSKLPIRVFSTVSYGQYVPSVLNVSFCYLMEIVGWRHLPGCCYSLICKATSFWDTFPFFKAPPRVLSNLWRMACPRSDFLDQNYMLFETETFDRIWRFFRTLTYFTSGLRERGCWNTVLFYMFTSKLIFYLVVDVDSGSALGEVWLASVVDALMA